MPRSKASFDAMRESTRVKIEAAALSLFARKGLSVTVGDIARAGGVSQGLLYSHYPSKDALIAELVRQATSISGQGIIDIAQSNALAVVKIRQITDMMCQMFAEHHKGIDYFMFMIQVGMSGFQVPENASYTADSPNPVETLARIVMQGQFEGSAVSGDPVQLSIVYWAVIQGLCCYAIAGMPVLPNPQMINRILLLEEI